MIGRRVAGLAVVVSEIEEGIVRELTESSIPTVFFDVGTPGGNITKIRVNYRKGIERVVEYLAALGHRNFAFIDHHSDLGPIDERRRAVFDTIRAVCPNAHLRFAADTDSLEGGRQAVFELLANDKPPTALLCVNDLMAIGAMKGLRERGLRIPEDVSVTGFDNVKLSEFCYPALTTVHIPRDRIGHTVFTSLAPESNLVNSRGKELIINPEFVVRDSTGPPRLQS